jgi:transcriptional regulator with XRE-family HTH domain
MPDYPFTTWFRRALRRYLDGRRISRNELARKLGATGATLHRYDRGLSFPDVDLQGRLAETFGVAEEEVARLVRESEKRRQQEARRLDAGQSEPSGASSPRKSRSKAKGTWLGCMAGTARITGDIVSPAIDESEWEMLRPPRR